MLYSIKKKDKVVFTDTRSKCLDRLKQLRTSQPLEQFKLVKAEADAEKFAQKPHDGSYRSGDYPRSPRRVR